MTDPITADDINEFLTDRDDFDLELFAYRALKNNGWSPRHGGTYTDPISSMPRQYDLRGTANFSRDTKIHLAIECKSLAPDNPLVISRAPRTETESVHDIIRSSREINTPMTYFTVNRIAKLGGATLYPAHEMVGKSTKQIRRNNKETKWTTSDKETYDKWSQALASSMEILQSAAEDFKEYSNDVIRSFVMPILVVSDSTLWVVDYDEVGCRSAPKKVDEATLYVDRNYDISWSNMNQHYRISHLHIYTRAGFLALMSVLDKPENTLWECIFGHAIRTFP
jgi:hypothetical protein